MSQAINGYWVSLWAIYYAHCWIGGKDEPERNITLIISQGTIALFSFAPCSASSTLLGGGHLSLVNESYLLKVLLAAHQLKMKPKLCSTSCQAFIIWSLFFLLTFSLPLRKHTSHFSNSLFSKLVFIATSHIYQFVHVAASSWNTPLLKFFGVFFVMSIFLYASHSCLGIFVIVEGSGSI